MLERLRTLFAPDYTQQITRLRAAIDSGRLSEAASLSDSWPQVQKIIGKSWFEDSLDLVEWVMRFEEDGIVLVTVGDLLRYLEQLQREEDDRRRPSSAG